MYNIEMTNAPILKTDFRLTSKPSLKVCKFVKLIILISDIKSITCDVLDSLGLAKLHSVD